MSDAVYLLYLGVVARLQPVWVRACWIGVVHVTGRETRGAFLKLTFQQQLDAICTDLQDDFWSADARLRIAANMFGLACGYVAVCLLAPLWLACGPDGAFLVGSPNTVRDKLHYVERPRNLGRPSSKISQGTRSAQCTCAVG